MRAVTASPGMAPDTSTIWPSTRAIIRPPAAGFSIVRRIVCLGVSIAEGRWLQKRDGRQAEPLSHEPVDGGLAGASVRIGAHRRAKTGELVVRVARQRRRR